MKKEQKTTWIVTAIIVTLAIVSGFMYGMFKPEGTIIPIQRVVEEPQEPETTRMDTLRAMATAFAIQETKCTERAVSPCGKYVGCLQISKIMVREANRILKQDVFTYDDRYLKQDSFRVFITVMDYRNPELDIDKAVDIWNINCPAEYRNNVKNNYKDLLTNLQQAELYFI